MAFLATSFQIETPSLLVTFGESYSLSAARIYE